MGNTGPEFEAKRLELLKEGFPEAIRVAYLATKDVWQSPAGQHVQAAARMLRVTLMHAEHTADNYADAFALMIQDRPDALLVSSSARILPTGSSSLTSRPSNECLGCTLTEIAS